MHTYVPVGSIESKHLNKRFSQGCLAVGLLFKRASLNPIYWINRINRLAEILLIIAIVYLIDFLDID